MLLICVYLYKLVIGSIAEGCWHDALANSNISIYSVANESITNMDVKGSCDGIPEDKKRAICIWASICHLYSHNRNADLYIPDSEECEEVTEVYRAMTPDARHITNDFLDLCVPRLTTNAFELYSNFSNHFDNLCYYYVSKSWFERVESSVNSLLESSQIVLSQLSEASKLQRMISYNQEIVANMQKDMKKDVEGMGEAISTGTVKLENMMDGLANDLMNQGQTLTTLLDGAIKTIEEVRSIFLDLYSLITAKVTSGVYIIILLLSWFYTKHLRPKVKYTIYSLILATAILSRYTDSWELRLGMTMFTLGVYFYGILSHQTDVQIIRKEIEAMKESMKYVHRECEPKYGKHEWAPSSSPYLDNY